MDIDKPNIIDFIRTVPDYPTPGINFYDINSLFASGIFNTIIDNLAKQIKEQIQYPTHIAGVESRGFVIGSAIAYKLNIPFVMIRKENSKYPGNLHKQSYNLEYGSNTLVLQEGIIGHTGRIVLVDDLIATGGSLLASQQLCESFGSKVIANVALIDLKYINTKEKQQLKNIISYQEIFND